MLTILSNLQSYLLWRMSLKFICSSETLLTQHTWYAYIIHKVIILTIVRNSHLMIVNKQLLRILKVSKQKSNIHTHDTTLIQRTLLRWTKVCPVDPEEPRPRASISQDYWGGHKRRLGVWGPQRVQGQVPQKLKHFCETTRNICVKIQQTVAVIGVDILNDITSKNIGGHYHWCPPHINIGGDMSPVP